MIKIQQEIRIWVSVGLTQLNPSQIDKTSWRRPWMGSCPPPQLEHSSCAPAHGSTYAQLGWGGGGLLGRVCLTCPTRGTSGRSETTSRQSKALNKSSKKGSKKVTGHVNVRPKVKIALLASSVTEMGLKQQQTQTLPKFF